MNSPKFVQVIGEAPKPSELPANHYLALLCAAGYETRSTFLAREHAPAFQRVWALDYEENQVLAYGTNRNYLCAVGEVLVLDPSLQRKHIALLAQEAIGEYQAALSALGRDVQVPLRFAVDISSMDRDRVARICLALLEDVQQPVEVDFFYAPAKYAPKLTGSEGTVLVNRPVEGLEGWTEDPAKALTCILGIGYEGRLALAALETLEPARTILFRPRGLDERYDAVVDQRNETLVAQSTLVDYELRYPYRTFLDLEALVHNLVATDRVVLVPLGPKLLALEAMLVAMMHQRPTKATSEVTVWRLSADTGRHPEDRTPSGEILGLSVISS